MPLVRSPELGTSLPTKNDPTVFPTVGEPGVAGSIARRLLFVHGSATHTAAVQTRRLGGAVQRRIEVRAGAGGVVIRIVVRQPQPEVERRLRVRLACVLNVAGKVVVEVLAVGFRARLRVRGVDAEQRVRERIAGVQRVGAGGREVDVRLHVRLRVARVRGALIVEAGLERVLPRALREVVDEVVDHEPLVERAEDRRIDRAAVRAGGDARDPAERQAGDQVGRVRVGKQQRRVDPGHRSRRLVVTRARCRRRRGRRRR